MLNVNIIRQLASFRQFFLKETDETVKNVFQQILQQAIHKNSNVMTIEIKNKDLNTLNKISNMLRDLGYRADFFTKKDVSVLVIGWYHE